MLAKSFKTQVNPVAIFELFREKPFSFLLYSGINNFGSGRYSFIGFEPFLILRAKGRKIQIIEDNYLRESVGNPLLALRDLLNQYKLKNLNNQIPFLAGAVGFLGYDLGFLLEEIEQRSFDDLGLWDCFFGFYDTVLCFDNLKKELFISSVGFPEKSSSLRKVRAEFKLKELVRLLSNFNNKSSKKFLSNTAKPVKPANAQKNEQENLCAFADILRFCGVNGLFQESLRNIQSNFTKESYINAIKKAKYYIKKGDIYQLNLSQRFQTKTKKDAFSLFKDLVRISPSAYSSFFDTGDFSIISSSPESFLKLKDGLVQSRPMKGTRPRGKTKKEDSRLKNELLKSAKDKAELMMIADLLRNDLGRVCSYGSVRVRSLRNLETYSTVFQTTATIEGRLHRDKDRIDLIKACFPGGSITGCPKIRAMEIIEELEPTRRSIYTGSLGYLDFAGNMELNILIRTILKKYDKIYFQTGGGIVADSIPEDEYEETLVKARGMLEAIKRIDNRKSGYEPVYLF